MTQINALYAAMGAVAMMLVLMVLTSNNIISTGAASPHLDALTRYANEQKTMCTVKLITAEAHLQDAKAKLGEAVR